MHFSKIIAGSALSSVALAEFQNGTVTTHVTATGYTTYCPYPITITLTICEEENICTKRPIVVSEPTTVTVTEPCIISTSYETTEVVVTTTLPSSLSPSSVAPANVTSFEGAGSKNVAGALVGVVAIAAAMM